MVSAQRSHRVSSEGPCLENVSGKMQWPNPKLVREWWGRLVDKGASDLRLMKLWHLEFKRPGLEARLCISQIQFIKSL